MVECQRSGSRSTAILNSCVLSGERQSESRCRRRSAEKGTEERTDQGSEPNLPSNSEGRVAIWDKKTFKALEKKTGKEGDGSRK